LHLGGCFEMDKTKTEFLPPSSADGATIVVLRSPVKWRGEETERVTIPALKGRHLARIPFTVGDVPTLGALVEWASAIVLPAGIVDELHPSDAIAIANEVYAALGKSLAIGETQSQS